MGAFDPDEILNAIAEFKAEPSDANELKLLRAIANPRGMSLRAKNMLRALRTAAMRVERLSSSMDQARALERYGLVKITGAPYRSSMTVSITKYGAVALEAQDRVDKTP